MDKIKGLEFYEIKELLKHVYFINGTAYAGKSTVCEMLADKYDMVHCEENFDLGEIAQKTTVETHPNLHYFETMSSWEEFVTRDKYTYAKWLDGTSEELTYLEIEYLLSQPKDKLIIVDTNITPEVLNKISDYNRVAFMVTTPEISSHEFFNRPDKEKQFLLEVIKKTDQPEKNLKNFKDMILFANRKEVIERFTKSGLFYTERKTLEDDINDKFEKICYHFGLE
jgi:adenylate kinase family enzyme